MFCTHIYTPGGDIPAGFVVDDAWHNTDRFHGLPLIPYSKMRSLFPPTEFEVYVAIGYGTMNAVRKEVYHKLRQDGYRFPNYIHCSAVNCSDELGEGNLIFPGVVLVVQTIIGDCNVFYPASLIAHNTQVGSFNFFAPRATLAGDISVGDRCFFGLGCSVKNGIAIKDRCLIGAGAYARTNMEEGNVLVSPHSFILDRDSEDIIKKVMK